MFFMFGLTMKLMKKFMSLQTFIKTMESRAMIAAKSSDIPTL